MLEPFSYQAAMNVIIEMSKEENKNNYEATFLLGMLFLWLIIFKASKSGAKLEQECSKTEAKLKQIHLIPSILGILNHDRVTD